MDFEEFKQKLQEKSKKIEVKIEYNKVKDFFTFMNILLVENEKINLTAITDENEIIVKHFIDSLSINKYLINTKKILDLGTGAGFPGIPLKIINNDKEFVLVDSLNKRIEFLKKLKEELKIDKLELIHSRAEDLAKNIKYREKFDVVTSRAVANLRTLAEYLLPFVRKDGICICMKGPNVDKELEEAKNSIKILGGRLEKVEKIFLNDNDVERNILIIRKIQNTPNKYPRKAGVPSKMPLWNIKYSKKIE